MATSAAPQTKSSMHHLAGERPKMHYLDELRGFNEGMAHGNLGYQMQYSVESLERQLSEEGNPHVLQLNAFSHDGNWKNPTTWHLYADGRQVACGDGLFAQQCFEQSAEAFRDACRQAVEQADLSRLSSNEYRFLKSAQLIARYEPFNDGSCAMGQPRGRVY